MGTPRVIAVQQFGEYAAKPGANAFLSLASYKVSAGRFLIAGLRQGVRYNAGPTTDPGNPAGLTWKAKRYKGSETTQDGSFLNLRPEKVDIPWTFPDGKITVARVVVPPGTRLDWGIDVTAFGSIPAEIDGFYGAIIGWDVSEDVLNDEPFYSQLLVST